MIVMNEWIVFTCTAHRCWVSSLYRELRLTVWVTWSPVGRKFDVVQKYVS